MSSPEVASLRGQGVRVVLNGGSRLLESATIPAQWFFEQETALKEPKWILVSVQHESVFEGGSDYAKAKDGDRYIFPVTDRIGFLQVFKPGRHRITFIACRGGRPEWFVHRDGPRRYFIGLDMTGLADNLYTVGVAGHVTEEIEVPAGLFAKRSTNAIAMAIWKWINRWHENEPRDQCQYRARAILAFTAQPVVVGVAYTSRYLFALMGTLVLGVGRFLVLFFGYRPLFLSGIRPLWNYGVNLKDLDWCYRRFRGPGAYRVWKAPHDYVGYLETGGVKKIPMAPSVFVLLGLAISGSAISLRMLAQQGLLTNILKVVIFGLFTLLVFGGAVLLARMVLSAVSPMKRVRQLGEKLKQKFESWSVASKERLSEEEKKRHKSYASWLSTEMAAGRAPLKVDLSHLPAPFKNSVLHKMRVVFWAAKVHVCRPFSRS